MPRRENKRKARVQTRRVNLTGHRRALANPEVKDKLVRLRKEWEIIDRVERGERLIDLARQGCSSRGLADAVGRSPTNIRRYMTFPSLPEREREAIRIGASAKRILTLRANAVRRLKMRNRVSLDEKTGVLSDELADAILEFCKTNKPKNLKRMPDTPIGEIELVPFLSETRNAAWQMEGSGVPPMTLPKRLTVRQRYSKTRPPLEPDLHYWVHLAQWLANLLRAEAPERPIWERAIEKAGKRSGELRIQSTNSQALQRRKQRLWEILQGPPRRPWYPGGALRLRRQGQQAR